MGGKNRERKKKAPKKLDKRGGAIVRDAETSIEKKTVNAIGKGKNDPVLITVAAEKTRPALEGAILWRGGKTESGNDQARPIKTLLPHAAKTISVVRSVGAG